uniref:CCDC92/74 N-terminal domain-containing protein n=1 Tax=Sinocyclocheilus anshuiensis TaxID=1608454 RepID=A0A671RGW0_9TELE
MDRSTLAQQVESVELNVAFLQQEHRILLSGLRLEIRNLKKRCSGLSLILIPEILHSELRYRNHKT